MKKDSDKTKKYVWGGAIGLAVLMILVFLMGRFLFPYHGGEDLAGLSELPELPKLSAPELSEGQRGELGIDKNINEATIDEYLGRSDAVYRDLRMLKDPGNYEAIGGDSYLSGFVKGFEIVPLPYIVNVSGLPEAVGETYRGETLFTEIDGKYVANYTESEKILEDLFPKDKVIFLMCGGGGYAGMMKKMLVSLGWDEMRIYNVGGYWYYEGENNVKVKRTGVTGEPVYDFYKVPYHEIDFSSLMPVKAGELVDITAEAYEKMMEEKRSFLLMVDQGGCKTADKVKEFIKEYSEEEGKVFYRIMFEEMKETSLHEYVKYYPSVVVIWNGQVKAYLRADADEDSDAYNKYDAFKEWMETLGGMTRVIKTTVD